MLSFDVPRKYMAAKYLHHTATVRSHVLMPNSGAAIQGMTEHAQLSFTIMYFHIEVLAPTCWK